MPQPPNAIIASCDVPASSDNLGNSPGLLGEVRLLGRELRAAAHSQVRACSTGFIEP